MTPIAIDAARAMTERVRAQIRHGGGRRPQRYACSVEYVDPASEASGERVGVRVELRID